MLYFAYGSNLLHQRLWDRTPNARPLTTGVLKGHSLRFHKIGDDGSGKCDAFHTGDDQDATLGVVYEISVRERRILDAIEGVGRGYAVKNTRIDTARGVLETFTYVVEPEYIDPAMLPFHWYKQFVLSGARQNDFEPGYIMAIRKAPSKPDPDYARSTQNSRILRGLSELDNYF